MIKIESGYYKDHFGTFLTNGGRFKIFLYNTRPSQVLIMFDKPATGRQILATLGVYLHTEFGLKESVDEVDERIAERLADIRAEKAVEEVLEHG